MTLLKTADLAGAPRVEPTVEPPPAVTVSVGYLHQVDVIRLITFGCVILVHALAQNITSDNRAGNAVEVVLHFTRNTFFALTAFVLFHSNYRRSLDNKQFWRRRIPVVLVPYLVWSSIYFGFWLNNQTGLSVVGGLRDFGYDIITGSAQYHLYFLLVSLQIYALFPVLRWVVRKTAGHHGLLFSLCVLAEAAYLTWHHYGDATGNSVFVMRHAQEVLTTYLPFICAGALAAVHLPELEAWMRARHRLVIASVGASMALAMGTYWINLTNGESGFFAADTLQPAIMVWSLVMALALLGLGMVWSDRRRAGTRTAGIVAQASRMSFGVYLVHPVMLLVAGNLGFNWQEELESGALVGTVYSWLIAVSLSVIFVRVILKTPLSMPLAGRRTN